jgi:hypothetical protein
MAAFQFDVIPSPSRLVRGRLVVEQIQPVDFPARVKWAYVEPAESTRVRAKGFGNWDFQERRLSLAAGFGDYWGTLTGFSPECAVPGATSALAVRSTGQHRAVLTVADSSRDATLDEMVESGAVRPRTDSQIGIVLNRTLIFTGPERRPALGW